jgi:hypothetical protein
VKAAPDRRLLALPWLALLCFPLIEVGAHALTLAGVASEADWRAAAQLVRQQALPTDLIVSAPSWTDPTLRLVLGDRIDLAMAGRSDTAAYGRLWSLSVRGARPPEAPAGAPELSRDFGPVRVERWTLGAPTVVHDLVEHVFDAKVELVQRGEPRPCTLAPRKPGRRGGLGFGAVPPARRFQCPDRRGFVWVAPIVMEDLELQPRRCVFQHPAGREPVRVTLPDVPLGERLVVHAGVYYEHERMRDGAPITLEVSIGGKPAGQMVHRDGEGWRRMEIDTRALGQRRAPVRFEVTTDNASKRIFCWAASTRSGSRVSGEAGR